MRPALSPSPTFPAGFSTATHAVAAITRIGIGESRLREPDACGRAGNRLVAALLRLSAAGGGKRPGLVASAGLGRSGYRTSGRRLGSGAGQPTSGTPGRLNIIWPNGPGECRGPGAGRRDGPGVPEDPEHRGRFDKSRPGRGFCAVMDLPPSEVLVLPGGPARVQWRRGPGRRISLRIDPRDGAVVVTLPPRAGRPCRDEPADDPRGLGRRSARPPCRTRSVRGRSSGALGGVEHRIRACTSCARRGVAPGRDNLVAGRPEFLSSSCARFSACRGAASPLRAGRREGGATPGAPSPGRREGHEQPVGKLCSGRVACLQLAAGDGAGLRTGLRGGGHEVAHLRHMNHGHDLGSGRNSHPAHTHRHSLVAHGRLEAAADRLIRAA